MYDNQQHQHMEMDSVDNRGMLSVDGEDPRNVNFEESKIAGHHARGADMRYSMQ